MGKAITFMAKYNYGLAGNSSHIHNSLWSADRKTPLFLDKKGPWGLSRIGQQWAAGQIKYAREYHLVPRALHQFLQALPGRHLGADPHHLEPRQPHGRLPPLRRRHQGRAHGVPHRRRRPQPLSRLRGADRRRARRHRREAGAAEALRRRRLQGEPHAAKSRRRCATRPKACRSRRCCARRSATTSSTTTSTPPSGSSSNTTAASPTGSCIGGSRGIEESRASCEARLPGRTHH